MSGRNAVPEIIEGAVPLDEGRVPFATALLEGKEFKDVLLLQVLTSPEEQTLKVSRAEQAIYQQAAGKERSAPWLERGMIGGIGVTRA